MLKILKKLRSIFVVTVILLAVVLMASCRNNGGTTNNNNQGAGQNGASQGDDIPLDTPGLIFNSKSLLNVVCLDEDFPTDLANEFSWAIKENLKTRATIISHKVDDVPRDHEIVFGKSDRSVSQGAYIRLERLMVGQGEEMGGYVLYSDGSSLALAYTVELGTQHLDDIMAELCQMAQEKNLVKKAGVISSKIFDMYEIYEAEDTARINAQWEALKPVIGEATVLALQDMYQSLYSNDIVSWLANLYEPRNCICDNYVDGVQVCLHPTDKDGNYICMNGGFYYSNSARNTLGFLPDIESTYQALTFLEMTGMLSQNSNSFGAFINGQMRSDLIAFTKGLQNPDGYFYHPQWTIEASRSQWSRVSRDLMWAEAILKKFEVRPFYNTPTGMVGTKPVTSASYLTESLVRDNLAAVSKVVAVADFADHLQSAEAFRTYLSKFQMDVYGKGYTATNELAAQVNQIKAADTKLGGALKPILFEFLEEKHNPDNGLWRAETDYDGLNTVFKALMVYGTFGVAFPYAEQAAESAIYVLSSEEVPGHVCGAYNTWYDIAGIIANIRKYHPSNDRAAIADSILEKVRKIAPAAITNTINNTLRFRREDGSFSYFENKASETSQGMVVCTGILEGDVNASLICSGGLIDHISSALGVRLPDIFGTRELAEFVDIIGENGFSVKNDLPPDVVADFEGEAVGIETSLVGGSVGSGGSCTVQVDPLNDENKALHLSSLVKASTWDAVTIPNNTVKADKNCLVFEGKFLFEKQGTSQGYLIQMYLGYMGKPTAYFINFTVTSKYVQVWEGSSDNNSQSFNRLLGQFDLDQWFKLRIEYYMGWEDELSGATADDTVRIKIYTNDELVAVSSNYMDNSMSKFEGNGTPVSEVKQALFFVMSYMEASIYFDDLYLGYKNIPYVSEKNTEGLIANEDAEFDRKEYGFEENECPEGVVIDDAASKITIDGEALKFNSISGTSTVTVKANWRAPHANVYAVGFDVKFNSAVEGKIFTIYLKDPDTSTVVARYTMKCAKIDGKLALVPVYKDATLLPSVAVFADGETYHLEFAFFVDQGTTLIYKNGEMLASTEQGVAGNHFLYEMGSAVIEYTGKADLVIDNIYCERRVGDFDEETRPKVDRVQLDFNSGNLSDYTNIKTNGIVSDGVLNIAGKYLTINANERSPYISTYQLYFDICTDNYKKGITTFKFLDSEDDTVSGLVMELKDGVMYIYEMLHDEQVGEYVGTFVCVGNVNIVINFHVKEGAIEVYADQALVLVTTQLNESGAQDVKKLTVTSEVAEVDNIYFDGITMTYTAPKVDAATKDDKDSVITYEYSSAGNYPDRVLVAQNSSQGSSIEYILRGERLTKSLVYRKYLSNYASGVRFLFSDGYQKTSLVFQTDIKFAGNFASDGWRSNFALYFSNTSGGTHMYVLQFVVENGHLWAYLGSNTNAKYDCGVMSADAWYNIRVEVDAGDGTKDKNSGTKLTLYVDGNQVYSGSDFEGSNAADAKIQIKSVYQVQLIANSGSVGTIYLDNTSLEPN